MVNKQIANLLTLEPAKQAIRSKHGSFSKLGFQVRKYWTFHYNSTPTQGMKKTMPLLKKHAVLQGRDQNFPHLNQNPETFTPKSEKTLEGRRVLPGRVAVWLERSSGIAKPQERQGGNLRSNVLGNHALHFWSGAILVVQEAEVDPVEGTTAPCAASSRCACVS